MKKSGLSAMKERDLKINKIIKFFFPTAKCRNRTMLYEPWHNKTNKVSVRPAKTQISLGIRPVWSESSLYAWRKLGSLATHLAHSEDSDQAGRMPRLIWVFAGRTLFDGFVMSRLYTVTCSSSFCHSQTQIHSEICVEVEKSARFPT